MNAPIRCLGAALLLAACTPAGCTPAQEQRTVVDGQLFCGVATKSGPLVVAIVSATGVPVVVTGMASAAVASICAVIAAIPVTPPPVPAAAPVPALRLWPPRTGPPAFA